MPRVKRGTIHTKSRRNLLKLVKGFKWGRKSKVRQANEASVHAGMHAFVDRRKKKRVNRALWQIKIGAFVRAQGLSYSRFMDGLKKSGIALDRKVLADLAEHNQEAMAAIVSKVSK